MPVKGTNRTLRDMGPTRKILGHIPPAGVPDGSWFFVTLCCVTRRVNQLCREPAATTLLADAAHYHRTQRWALHVLLLMPDHLHMIAGFPRDERMSDVIRDWKRLSARRAGIEWQKNYFDHRLRADESLELKSDYIRANPVRAGLVARAEEWPHVVRGVDLDTRTREGDANVQTGG